MSKSCIYIRLRLDNVYGMPTCAIYFIEPYIESLDPPLTSCTPSQVHGLLQWNFNFSGAVGYSWLVLWSWECHANVATPAGRLEIRRNSCFGWGGIQSVCKLEAKTPPLLKTIVPLLSFQPPSVQLHHHHPFHPLPSYVLRMSSKEEATKCPPTTLSSFTIQSILQGTTTSDRAKTYSSREPIITCREPSPSASSDDEEEEEHEWKEQRCFCSGSDNKESRDEAFHTCSSHRCLSEYLY